MRNLLFAVFLQILNTSRLLRASSLSDRVASDARRACCNWIRKCQSLQEHLSHGGETARGVAWSVKPFTTIQFPIPWLHCGVFNSICFDELIKPYKILIEHYNLIQFIVSAVFHAKTINLSPFLLSSTKRKRQSVYPYLQVFCGNIYICICLSLFSGLLWQYLHMYLK